MRRWIECCWVAFLAWAVFCSGVGFSAGWRQTDRRVHRIYIGEIKGHPGEADTLRELLQEEFSRMRFTVVDRPEAAEATLVGFMGFRDVWGEYTASKDYRVVSQIQMLDGDGRPFWRFRFVKAPVCSYGCFRRSARKIANAFRERLPL